MGSNGRKGRPSAGRSGPPRAQAGAGVRGELGYATCQQCGSTPAGTFSFRCRSGPPLAARGEDRVGAFCRDCATTIGRDVTNRNLLWSAARINKFKVLGSILHNRREMARIGSLSSPRKVSGTQMGAPLVPRRRVLLRGGVLMVLAQLAVGAALAVLLYNNAPGWIDRGTPAPVTPSTLTSLPG